MPPADLAAPARAAGRFGAHAGGTALRPDPTSFRYDEAGGVATLAPRPAGGAERAHLRGLPRADGDLPRPWPSGRRCGRWSSPAPGARSARAATCGTSSASCVRYDEARLLEFTRLTCDLIAAMRALPRPIVASLNGTAAGAGAAIALASDLRVAADHREDRVPVREGRPGRGRHGRGPPAAAGGGPRPGDRAADDRRVHRRRGGPAASASTTAWSPPSGCGEETAALVDVLVAGPGRGPRRHQGSARRAR